MAQPFSMQTSTYKAQQKKKPQKEAKPGTEKEGSSKSLIFKSIFKYEELD